MQSFPHHGLGQRKVQRLVDVHRLLRPHDVGQDVTPRDGAMAPDGPGPGHVEGGVLHVHPRQELVGQVVALPRLEPASLGQQRHQPPPLDAPHLAGMLRAKLHRTHRVGLGMGQKQLHRLVHRPGTPEGRGGQQLDDQIRLISLVLRQPPQGMVEHLQLAGVGAGDLRRTPERHLGPGLARHRRDLFAVGGHDHPPDVAGTQGTLDAPYDQGPSAQGPQVLARHPGGAGPGRNQGHDLRSPALPPRARHMQSPGLTRDRQDIGCSFPGRSPCPAPARRDRGVKKPAILDVQRKLQETCPAPHPAPEPRPRPFTLGRAREFFPAGGGFFRPRPTPALLRAREGPSPPRPQRTRPSVMEAGGGPAGQGTAPNREGVGIDVASPPDGPNRHPTRPDRPGGRPRPRPKEAPWPS